MGEIGPITPARLIQILNSLLPDPYMQDNHWESGEIDINAAGADFLLGAPVAAGKKRRVREITVRHAGTNNTVITLKINGAGGAISLSIDVPAQTTRVWSSQDGRIFLAAIQPAIQSSDITNGHTFVSASGIEAT